MKKWFSLLLALLLVILACTAAVGCGEGKDNGGTGPGGDDGNDPTPPEKVLSDPIQIVMDNKFSQGFDVKGQQDGIGTVFGQLVYDDENEYDPVWQLAQWYCGYYHKVDGEFPASYNILNSERVYNEKRNLYIWSDESKTLRVNPDTGSIYIGLQGTKEYTEPRAEGKPWPHLLLEYNVQSKHVASLDSLTLNLDFTLMSFKGDMGAATDFDQHCAQLPYYIIVQNRNRDSEGYGEYIWFGASLYDNRYDFTMTYASVDAGSDDKIATDAFIYKPGSKEYLPNPVVVGEENKIEWDMLPYIKTAYQTARSNGYLTKTNFEDLYVTSGNLGWEITGTYDAAVQIDRFEIWAVEEIKN